MAHIQSNYAIIKLPNLICPKIAQLMKCHSDMAPIRMYWIFVFILTTIIILHAEYWILNLFRFHVSFSSRSVDCDNFVDGNHLLIFFKKHIICHLIKKPACGACYATHCVSFCTWIISTVQHEIELTAFVRLDCFVCNMYSM